MMSVVGCNHNRQSTQNGNTNDSISTDTSGYYMEFRTMSDMDMWLRVSSSDLKTSQLKRLADAYNAATVMNSIITDFDLQMRGFDLDDVIVAIKSIDVTRVEESEVKSKLLSYKREMLYLLSVNPDSVNQEIHNPWKAKDDL